MANVEQPKKAPSGYWLFLSDQREAIEKELGTKRGPDVAKKGGEMWKAASEDVRKPYEEKAAKLKAEYDSALQAFKADGGVVTRKSKKSKEDKKKAKKDPDMPKKPAGGGYAVYMSEHREEIMKSLPANANKITDTAKVGGARWKALSDADKKVYDDKYNAKKEEYGKAMEEYKAKRAEAAAQEPPAASPVGKTTKKRRVDESEKKVPLPKKARVSKGASKKNEIEIDEKILAQAKKVAMDGALKNLASRSEIAALGISAEKMLSTLQKHNGLVNAAKHALLGA